MKKSSIATDIGLLIRQIRVEKGLSQEDLAFNCELHRTYIGSLERGEKVATIVTLEKITKALGISLSDFFKKHEKIQTK